MVAPRLPETTVPPLAEPQEVSGALARAHRRYWHFNLTLIGVLMTVGFSVSFVVPLFARELAGLRFAGFSLPFYLGAQGAIVIYLVLIVVYILAMGVADRALLRVAQADRVDDAARESAP